jgi:hypothetical protein
MRMARALSLWGAAFAVVAGFLYYHTAVPLGPVLVAGVLTLVWTVVRTLKDKPS